MWGLRFMPPCTPFGADASCGLDFLLLIPIVIGFAFVVFELLTSSFIQEKWGK
jgi:hypothetical protein